ncbi:hypothetical protein ZEAMMB73_Zm00001d029042 [Zea mays]|jgi:hypothetical protein|uniref:Uncharacterized protein n=1 Tax=Zea mays TaxID=4577 RepID=A0A1D6K1W6_MAIZE|nr:hypothetical protein ZEAMMB73_Zm00001d029042 [Zea mays]
MAPHGTSVCRREHLADLELSEGGIQHELLPRIEKPQILTIPGIGVAQVRSYGARVMVECRLRVGRRWRMGLRTNLGMCDTGGDSGRGGEGHKAMVGMGSSGRRQTQEWWRAEQGKKAIGKRARASGTTPSLPTSFFSLSMLDLASGHVVVIFARNGREGGRRGMGAQSSRGDEGWPAR